MSIVTVKKNLIWKPNKNDYFQKHTMNKKDIRQSTQNWSHLYPSLTTFFIFYRPNNGMLIFDSSKGDHVWKG